MIEIQFLQMLVRILYHYNRRIHHRADGDRDPPGS